MKNVWVLQGLNFLSPTSVVVMEIQDEKEVKDLLDLISSFHPIFIKKYYVKDSYLYIETPIPFLWREASQYIQKLSNKKISYEECREYLVETLIKQRIASMSTIPLLYSAYNLQKEITPTVIAKEIINFDKGYSKAFNRHHTIGCGKNSEIIYSISSSKDSKIAKEIQKDKWSTNIMIERLGLPIPRWEVINDKDDIEKIWKDYEKPVVIKPTGLTGGSGVVVGVKTLEECKKAYDFAQKAIDSKPREEWQRKLMIQEQVQGEDYRLLVIDGKLEIVTKRIPAFIVGNGKSSIEELIEQTNSDTRRDITNPSHTLKPIFIDEALLDYLKEQKLSLTDIPEKDEKIQVRKVASMSQGGITEDFTEQVSAEIKYIVESIAQSIHAFTLGVDVLCKDISKPLTKDNGAILEVNTMPEAYLNLFPVLGTQRAYVIDTYVKKLLKQNRCKRIVVIGNPEQNIPTLLKEKFIFWSYLKDDEVVGEYREGEIKINGLDINEGLVKADAVESLKVNASLDAIIIHHRNWEDVEGSGLGFNKIDMLIVTKEMRKDKKFRQILNYRFKGLISKIKFIK